MTIEQAFKEKKLGAKSLKNRYNSQITTQSLKELRELTIL